jgi:hypothetical protein
VEWVENKRELGCIWWVYFVSKYERRRMKHVEIILRRVERGRGK